jgi:hypothetical protein
MVREPGCWMPPVVVPGIPVAVRRADRLPARVVGCIAGAPSGSGYRRYPRRQVIVQVIAGVLRIVSEHGPALGRPACEAGRAVAGRARAPALWKSAELPGPGALRRRPGS